jgi:Neutral/alkaline non-lysosomal ceramidase, N-terminal
MASHVMQIIQPVGELSKTALEGESFVFRSEKRCSDRNLPSRGPGFRVSDFESNRIIGDIQFRGAQKIMGQQLSPVSGAVRSVHVYVEMCVDFPHYRQS